MPQSGPQSASTATALIGSGFIADVHLQVLARVRGVAVVALCDTVPARAERLAQRYGVPRVFASVADLLKSDLAAAVHVLVPPGAHRAVAEPCLRAGLHVLVEKPLALSVDDAEALAAAAAARGVALAVNHNLTMHPAVAALQRHLARGRLGRLEHLAIVHHVPLRQLQTGDLSHFMFQSEGNILLEQGVHVFSLVHALLGEGRVVAARTAPGRVLGNGVRFVDRWQLELQCARGTASVTLAFGRPLTETTLHALGSDGACFVDLQRNACWLRRKTRWLDFLDHAQNLGAGAHLLGRAAATVAGYGLSLFSLRAPDDPFLASMAASLGAFHAAVRGQQPLRNPASDGVAVLRLCAGAAAAAGASLEPPAPPPPLPVPGPARPREVVVLGGTGTIGRCCVALLQQQGRPLTLVVRRPQLLPRELRDGSVRVFAGDAGDAAVLQQACAGADAVLHLATVAGDGGAVDTAMAAAVRAAGAACQQAGVRRLVYASSTAALWLGGRQPVTGATPPDARPDRRAAYARGKIAAERELAALAAQGLDVVIVRPAIVLAPGAGVEHSGIGLWVRDNHCVGWGTGRVGLPLVLAEDCAQGLVGALDSAAAAGRCYNLAGPVRPTAREFLAELRARTGRDYHFHATPVAWLWLQEACKYLIKLLARRPRALPSLRDLRSRSFRAPLDCRDAERDLGFRPEPDRARFLERLLGAPPGDGAGRA